MKPPALWLRTRYPTGSLARPVTDADWSILVEQDADLFKPDGKRLLSLRRGVLSQDARDQAQPALNEVRRRLVGRFHDLSSANRRVAGGMPEQRRVKKDGTLTRSPEALDRQPSGIVGFFERAPRADFCRQLFFNSHFPDLFAGMLPLLREMGQAFAAAVPERYAAQKSFFDRTHPDFRIEGTPYTTVTVNHNWQTHLHRDNGDLDEGFSCLTALRRGSYKGALLVVPAFRVAVDLRDGDLLLMDAHEAHGNTPFVDASEDFERLSMVAYYRTGMQECLSAAEELERVKSAHGSLEEDPS